jgi:hypothetical protein
MTDNLRALALAATEGPWVHATNGFAPIGAVETQCGDSIAQAHQVNATCDRWQRNKNAAFIAAANPAAVLALLDEIDRLKAEIADHCKAYELLFKECAGLRKDAERYRWLCTMLGETQLPTLIERITSGYVADYKPSIDAAIDAATLAAKGESHAD